MTEILTTMSIDDVEDATAALDFVRSIPPPKGG